MNLHISHRVQRNYIGSCLCNKYCQNEILASVKEGYYLTADLGKAF